MLIDPSGFGGHRVVHHTENGEWSTMEPDDEPMPSGAGYGYEGDGLQSFGGGGGPIAIPSPSKLKQWIKTAKRIAKDIVLGVGHGIAEEGGQTTHYDGGVAYFAAKATTHLAFAYGEFSGAIGSGIGAFLGYVGTPESGGLTLAPAIELTTLAVALGAKGVHSLVLLNRTIQQVLHSPMAGDGGGGPEHKGLTREQQKSLRSLRQRAAEHEAKLKAYKANPEAFDNKGFLKKAPNNQVRQRIIQSRIRHLESEIGGFRKQIEELERLR